VHWPAKRNEIAQSQARKRLHAEPASETLAAEKNDPATGPEKDAVPKVVAGNSTNKSDSDDDDVFLGDMFSTISDAPTTQLNPSGTIDPSNVILRDFGKVSGLTPRKVLEEAVRSR